MAAEWFSSRVERVRTDDKGWSGKFLLVIFVVAIVVTVVYFGLEIYFSLL